MHYLNVLLSFINNNVVLIYGVIFLLSLFESLALVGLLIPGTVIMFSIGAIVATGSLRLIPVLIVSIIGAIAGDGISYWLGHHYKERLMTIWPFSHYPKIFKKGEVFFNKHGGKSILFGRFVGPVRPIVPVMAGMLGMSPVRFTVVNVVSAIGWALVYILPGVIFGASLAVAGTVSTRLTVLMIILIIGIWILLWLCFKLVYLLERIGPKGLAALKKWSTKEVYNDWLIVRYVKKLLSFLIFSEEGEELLFASLSLLFFISIWGFLGVLRNVITRDSLITVDQVIYHFLQSLRTPWIDNIFIIITSLGDSFVNIILTFIVLLILLIRRCYRAAIFFALTVFGGLTIVQLLKWTIHLPRPVNIYHGNSVYGFPSSHTAMNVIIYGFLVIMMVRHVGVIWRWLLFFIFICIAFAIGFSRLYLGVHWFSDVLGGYFIALSWISFLGLMYLKVANKAVPRRLLSLVIIVVVAVIGGWHASYEYKKDLFLYATRHDMKMIDSNFWLSNGWRSFPTYRIDLAGEEKQPLTIQWASSADELVKYLKERKWKKPGSPNLEDFLKMLSSEISIKELPVLPRLHNGLVDVIRLVKYIDNKHRWILRLWPTYTKTDNNTQIYEGMIEVQKLRHLAGVFFLAMDSRNYDLPLNNLKMELEKQFFIKQVVRDNIENTCDRKKQKIKWQGKVLLIYYKKNDSI